MDRNLGCNVPVFSKSQSLSARRAWIEMLVGWSGSAGLCVALRKESVDRNKVLLGFLQLVLSRSPQGERG